MKFTALALILSLGLAHNEYQKEAHQLVFEHHDDDDHRVKPVVFLRQEERREHSHDDDDRKKIVVVKTQPIVKIIRDHSPAKRELSRERVVITHEAVDAARDATKRIVRKELGQLHEQQELLLKTNQKAAIKAHIEAEKQERKEEHREHHRERSHGKPKVVEVVVGPIVANGAAQAAKDYSRRVIKKDLHDIHEQEELLQRKNVQGFAKIHERAEAQRAEVAKEQHEDEERARRRSRERSGEKIKRVAVIAKPVRVAVETRAYGIAGPFAGQWKKGYKEVRRRSNSKGERKYESSEERRHESKEGKRHH